MKEKHTGSKYEREFMDLGSRRCTIDVYSVLVAFNVTNPGTQHAIKKLLCAGLRGKADAKQDLTEAIDAIKRAIEIEDDTEIMAMQDAQA